MSFLVFKVTSIRIRSFITALFIVLIAPLNANAAPSCAQLFKLENHITPAEKIELVELLEVLDIEARVLLESYHYRPNVKRNEKRRRSRFFGTQPPSFEVADELGRQTIKLRQVFKRKNQLLRKLSKGQQDTKEILDTDAELNYIAQYYGRIEALSILIKSHLALMPEDIYRSENMTSTNKFSVEATPLLQAMKVKNSDDLQKMIAQLSSLEPYESTAEPLSKSQKKILLDTLKTDGDAMIRRLMFRFKIEPELVETLLNEWSKVHARKSREIRDPYLDRSKDYSFWPL